VVADFVEALDRLLSRMVSNAFRDHVPKDAPPPVTVESFFPRDRRRAFVQGLGKRGTAAAFSGSRRDG
jgi:hypothetical protein